MYITVVLRNGTPLSIPCKDEKTAREIIKDAHDAINARRAVNVGNSAVFAHEDIAVVYATNEPVTDPAPRSLFESVFGKDR